jgi:hypothetical protein
MIIEKNKKKIKHFFIQIKTFNYLVLIFSHRYFDSSIVEERMVENARLIKEVLKTLITISGRKTTQSHAVYLLETTLNKLRKQYSFLDTISVKDTTYLEDIDQITVMGEVNNIKSNEFGSAVKDIISQLNKSLGTDAGHFFLKEISQKLNDESISTLKDIGIDLDLMHLELQISKMEQDMLK